MNILKEVLTNTLLGTSESFDEVEEQKRVSMPAKEKLPKKEEGTSELPKGKMETRQIPVGLGREMEPLPEDQVLVLEKRQFEREPVIEQVIKPRQLTEVQPVITREREQTEIHEILQPLREREVLPPTMEEKRLPTIEGQVVESDASFQREYEQITEGLRSKVKVEDLTRERVVNEPIVQEVVRKRIIEEIQPVIHKETVVPHVIKETQPIRERIVEAPRIIRGEFESHKHDERDVNVETVTRNPILEEIIVPKEITEVQPVITREREITEVHEVLQPLVEKEILPMVVEEKELPQLDRGEIRESPESFTREYEELSGELRSTVEVGEVQREKVVKAPIVQEIIHKRIVEEIQPIIHKETIVPHIIRETLPIHEKIIEAPKLYREELEERDLGTVVLGLPSETDESSM